MATAQEIGAQLAEPFDPREVQFKPTVVKGNRALAMAYLNARCVMDRLDDVVGVAGWQDDYEITSDGSVICSLKVLIEGEWVRKTDVGSPSEQPDGGDRLKAAFSDALKRVAVKFGIGRYLYRLKAEWEDFDPNKKQFVNVPRLPDWAIPKQKPADQPTASKPAEPKRPTKPNLPADGKELHNRLNTFEGNLVRDGKCKAGDLLRYVSINGGDLGWDTDLTTWAGDQIKMACDWAMEFGPGKPAPAVTAEIVRQKLTQVYGTDLRKWLQYAKLPNLDALKMANAETLAKWASQLDADIAGAR